MKRTFLLFVMMLAAAQAQTLETRGEPRLTMPELPAPEWKQTANGQARAELRISGQGASALRVNFGSLHLAPGAELYIYGKDAAGNIVAIHGPYTGRGPLNVPEFDSRIVPGAELVVAVTGHPAAAWPFTLHGVEQFNAETLPAEELQAAFRPAPARKRPVDFRSAYIGDTLVHYNVEDGVAVMESDIVLGEVDGGKAGKSGEKASFSLTNSLSNMWPYGVIPYTIANGANIPMGGSLDTKIRAAIAYWNSRFPGILVPRNNQADYVTFRFFSGVCRTIPGRQGGQQLIEVDDGCSQGNVTHEIGHALGFLHEHTRYDRDNFVSINWSNIETGADGNFKTRAAGTAVNIGSYDFGSIMHYGPTFFAIDDTINTITPLVPLPAGVTMGQRNALSAGDEAGVRARYCTGTGWYAPSIIEVDNTGGSASFSVSMPPYCAWQITESLSWVTVNSAMSGTGSTTVTFTATDNTTNKPRSGAIRINNKSVSIKQIPDTWQY